ncbi:MAG: plasmid partition protein ParG [Desulfopila sp.]|nr:plasmid partition protein ParG [Desulfopila sp.]
MHFIREVFTTIMKNDKLKQLTLRLPEELHRKFKVNTAKKGQSMGAVAIDLIKKYLEEKTDLM